MIDDTGQLKESVLEKAASEEDGKVLVLTVRAGVMFHDSRCGPAAEATGKDLAFSILEATDHDQLDLDFDRTLVKPFGRELRLPLKTPALSFLQALSHVWLVPAKSTLVTEVPPPGGFTVYDVPVLTRPTSRFVRT